MLRRISVPLLLATVVSACFGAATCRQAADPRSAAAGGETGGSATPPVAEQLTVEVVEVYPHDQTSYTQGLLWTPGDRMYESSGGYGESALRASSLETGEIHASVTLEASLFGEGLALVDQRLIQLTWKEGLAFWYRPNDLEKTGETRFRGEGWGLTFDGNHLVMSDGTHVLTYRDPESLQVQRRLPVRKQSGVQDQLNELEWVDGQLYANVYETNQIVRIDPTTGFVTAVIDAAGLLTASEERSAEVLNGIAYRASTQSFLLTGKYWPKMFEVRFRPATVRGGPSQ